LIELENVDCQLEQSVKVISLSRALLCWEMEFHFHFELIDGLQPQLIRTLLYSIVGSYYDF